MTDLSAAFRAGVQDFVHAPLFGLFFAGIYVLGGLLILGALTVMEMPWMIIPVAVGFPLLCPFVAAGLYEVSRRRLAKEPLAWRSILLTVVQQRHRQLGWMAFVVLFVFWVWMYQVRLLLALFLGFSSFSTIGDFLTVITTTSNGLTFLAVGTALGAALSLLLYALTVTAMPLLMDRDVDFVSAMILSVRTVTTSPLVMIGWGLAIGLSALLALLPGFVGLLVVLPIFGHATWHLYRRAFD